MKIILKKILSVITVMVVITSCNTFNDVASSRGIIKRKYTKGFYISKNIKGLDSKEKVKTKSTEIKKENVEIKNETPLITLKKDNHTDEIKQNLNNNSTSFFISESPQFTDVNTFKKKYLKLNVVNQNKSKIKKYNKLSAARGNDVIDVIFGIIFCLLGLTPLGIWMIFGKGGKFILNLILYVGGILAIIASLVLVFFMPILSVALLILGILMLAAAYIHAFVLLIKMLE